jgi:hypothetical protein
VLYVTGTRASIVYHVEALLTRSRGLFPSCSHKVVMDVRRASEAELIPIAVPLRECEQCVADCVCMFVDIASLYGDMYSIAGCGVTGSTSCQGNHCSSAGCGVTGSTSCQGNHCSSAGSGVTGSTSCQGNHCSSVGCGVTGSTSCQDNICTCAGCGMNGSTSGQSGQ